MESKQHDLVIIGAGPGGYVAAIRAAQLGMNVACVEKEPVLGGTCLRVGCIPSKALLESSERLYATRNELAEHGIEPGRVRLDLEKMLARKDRVVQILTRGVDGLFRKNKVVRYQGVGRLTESRGVVVENGEEKIEIRAPKILIATGSRTAELQGVKLDGERIGTSTEALAYPQVPKHLVVIGAGYIGLELGCVWQRLGAKVTVVEYLDRILPGMDSEIAKEAMRMLTKQGLEFRLGVKVTSAKKKGKGCEVAMEGSDPLRCNRVLLAVGRRPNTEGLGLEEVGLETDDQGRIPVDERFATAVDGVYAIGDVIRGPMLAHKAEEEGIACVEMLAGKPGHVDYQTIPGVVYTFPEIAAVGKTEDQLKEEGTEYQKGVFPLTASGRARAIGSTVGRVKILAHAGTDRVLGVHILAPHAGELIAEAATSMAYGASSEDIARCCHAHPTLSESLKEAALAVHDRAIHV